MDTPQERMMLQAILSNPQMVSGQANESLGGLLNRRLGATGMPNDLNEKLKAAMMQRAMMQKKRQAEWGRMQNMNRGILANPMGIGEFLGILSGGAL